MEKMSVSVNIIAKREVTVYDADITYNLAKMYYKALDKNLGLKRLNDLRCKEALPIIDNAIKDMVCNKKDYEKFLHSEKLNKNSLLTIEGRLRRMEQKLSIDTWKCTN